MLTRLRVSGFKNLVGADVRFGPFTCIAGANGVGKSNLLDAISFLSALSDHSLIESAMSVRDDDNRKSHVESIFHRHGSTLDRYMAFEAEMVIPTKGFDDLGQSADATTTFVRYKLGLRLREPESNKAVLPIEIVNEELTHIRAGETKASLGFRVDKSWLDSAVRGKRSAPFYISTSDDNGTKTISVHQDGGAGGRSRKLAAATLPRTVLSSANANENPTATLVRREMQSWKRLQLEPSALRSPDNFTSPTSMGSDGSHLPSTLCELARNPIFSDGAQTSKVYRLAANRLAQLLDDVRELRVDRDEKRDLLTLQVAGRDGTFHPARALSDGTLRFLALAVLELDPKFQGVVCLEEPENGIHPARIPAILSLLQDIAVSLKEPVSFDNPLRQVIINTHSPAVVTQVPESSLLIAESRRVSEVRGPSYEKVTFGAVAGTWRADKGTPVVAKGKLLSYLNPVAFPSDFRDMGEQLPTENRRLVDDPSYQLYLFGAANR